jgi:hypothetical protein
MPGACAIALSACGGSSGGGLSKAQLATKVNAACSAYTKGVNAIPVPSDYATNANAAAAYLDKLKPLVDAEKNAIVSLKPDSSVKADFDQYVTNGQHQYALFSDAVRKAHAADPSGLLDIQASQTYKRTVLEPLERKLGFTSCLGNTS